MADLLEDLSRELVRPVQTALTEHRKLAAIMFTDMVGYSALSP
jgi:class 3 adenylate cyclase